MRVTLIALALAACVLPAGAQTAPEPAVPMFHLEFSGQPCTQAGQELAISKILAEPEVREFVDALLKPMMPMVLGQAEEMGIDAEATLKLLGALTVRASLFGVEMSEGPRPEPRAPDLAFEITAPGQGEMLGRYLGMLKGMAGQQPGIELSEVKMAAQEVTCWKLEDAPFVIYTHFAGDRLIGAVGEARMAQLVGAANGLDDLVGGPRLRLAQKHVGKDPAALGFWFDMKGLTDFLALAPEDEEEVAKIRALILRSGIGGVAYSLRPEGAGFKESFFLEVSEEKGNWMRDLVPAGLDVHRAVPADTAGLSASSISWSALHDLLFDVMETLEPRAADEMKGTLGEIDAWLGASLRDDLLPLIGNQYALYMSWPGQAIVPDIGMLTKPSDPAALDRFLVALAERKGAADALTTLKFRGHELRVMNVMKVLDRSGALGEDLEEVPNVRLTWVVVGDHLLIAPWPQVAKHFVMAHQGGEVGVPHLARHGARVGMDQGGLTQVEYMDMKSLAGFLLDNFAPIANLLPSPPGMPVEIPWERWPVTGTVTRHLFPLVGASRWTEDGLVAHYHSPTGYMTTTVGLQVVGFAVPFLVFRAEAEPMPMPMPVEPGGDDGGR